MFAKTSTRLLAAASMLTLAAAASATDLVCNATGPTSTYEFRLYKDGQYYRTMTASNPKYNVPASVRFAIYESGTYQVQVLCRNYSAPVQVTNSIKVSWWGVGYTTFNTVRFN